MACGEVELMDVSDRERLCGRSAGSLMSPARFRLLCTLGLWAGFGDFEGEMCFLGLLVMKVDQRIRPLSVCLTSRH